MGVVGRVFRWKGNGMHVASSEWDELVERVEAGEADVWAFDEVEVDGCEAVSALWSWSLNFAPGEGPVTLFLDLIGWSDEEIGEKLYPMGEASLGYLELDRLADALKEYTSAPRDVEEYVRVLMLAESVTA